MLEYSDARRRTFTLRFLQVLQPFDRQGAPPMIIYRGFVGNRK